jgi:hypothetical protein
MPLMYYIGLDVHKLKISYCVNDSSGKLFAEGIISATRLDLDHWMKTLPQPWSAASDRVQRLDLRPLEATCRCAESSSIR